MSDNKQNFLPEIWTNVGPQASKEVDKKSLTEVRMRSPVAKKQSCNFLDIFSTIDDNLLTVNVWLKKLQQKHVFI